MSHTSPSSYLVWAILSSMLGIFLVYHLYSFDKFKCLKWNNGPYSGAFKRIMTYSYLLSVPLIMTYAIGFAVIKYKEGYISLELEGVIPTPYQLWSPLSRSAIFPLTLCFTFAWALEMVTHLEELCFWLFLVNAQGGQQDWFKSHYFKTWVVGTFIALLYMPLVTIFTRSDPLKNEAYTFLAGSLGSVSLTIWFMPILWTFPSFLNKLKSEGVDNNTVIRLTKFHELNTIRVLFRYLFTVPILILGIDGSRPHQHINENPFWTDLLTFIAAIGCIISSGITLIIFFPRSVETEIAARDASKERKRLRSQGSVLETRGTNIGTSISASDLPASYTHLRDSTFKPNHSLHDYSPESHHLSFHSDDKIALPDRDEYPLSEISSTAIRPNRKRGDDVELGGIGPPLSLTEANLSRHNLYSSVNPMVHSYTSPINMVYGGNNRSNASRLTFTRR
ncbi:hypothetical protein EV361DRAFT_973630 [Lentinula raphanica]|uniref:Uncharacterized protein n=1 Tax=Lentinula raphanica TaxID=153919 RepID=A0AA38P887_9AGAR|nr:hypothetical protein EV360DRAFT_97407 [Lentinula raphanica]KAJ3837971.1 hypothetical protein F5878DRAFT_652319 [Lentinula raphanica]KAJ3966382.1 hypothetical protein EV361DRAFT_973630 [Lentinula raphanica]